MRILIKSEGGRQIRLHLPTALLCNAITAGLLCKKSHREAAENDTEIEISHRLTYPQARKLMRALRKCRHVMNGLPLVEVESHEGEKVQIHL